MQEAREIVQHGQPSDVLELPFESRQRSRLRASLKSGKSIGLFLPRGIILRDGTLLKTTSGSIIVVRAAAESVSSVTAPDTHLLMRVAYHLGNRHVPLQVEPRLLRYQHDHVLDDMVRQLGASVRCEKAPFEPEAGAYGGGHSHSREHSHTHHDH